MNEKSSQANGTDLGARLERIEMAMVGTVPANEIDLREVYRTLWSGKWFIAGVTAISAVVSVAVALWLPNEYKATAVFTPASTSSTSSLSRLAGQFGGLAALAGVNLGANSSGDKTVVAMELIKSWGFLEQFIRDNQIEVAVFAARGWHRVNNSLVINSDLYDVTKTKWVRKFEQAEGKTAAPSGWELYQGFVDRISISQDKKTNLISLSVEFYSPYLAKEWVEELATAVNKHIQAQDRQESVRSIQYLQEKLAQTNLTEMKLVFSRLIEEQTKNLMLADVSEEYVLKTLSAAKVPEEKSKPRRAILCVLGTFMGGLFGAIAWVWYRTVKGPATSA